MSHDSLRTFRLHVIWAAIAGVLLLVSFRFHHDYTAMRLWAGFAAVTGGGPLLIMLAARLRRGKPSRPIGAEFRGAAGCLAGDRGIPVQPLYVAGARPEELVVPRRDTPRTAAAPARPARPDAPDDWFSRPAR